MVMDSTSNGLSLSLTEKMHDTRVEVQAYGFQRGDATTKTVRVDGQGSRASIEVRK